MYTSPFIHDIPFKYSMLPFILGYLHKIPNKTYFIKYYHIGEGGVKGHTYISEEFVCQFIIYLTNAGNYRFELLNRIKQDSTYIHS